MATCEEDQNMIQQPIMQQPYPVVQQPMMQQQGQYPTHPGYPGHPAHPAHSAHPHHKTGVMDYMKKHKLWFIIIIIAIVALIWWFCFKKPGDSSEIIKGFPSKIPNGSSKGSGESINIKRSMF